MTKISDLEKRLEKGIEAWLAEGKKIRSKIFLSLDKQTCCALTAGFLFERPELKYNPKRFEYTEIENHFGFNRIEFNSFMAGFDGFEFPTGGNQELYQLGVKLHDKYVPPPFLE